MICLAGGGQGGRSVGGGSLGGRGSRWGVFGGAFGLERCGMEDAIVAVGAVGEGLGVVLEGVGWWLGAFVAYVEFAALLEEGEVDVGAYAMDAARGYVAGDAEVADVGLAAHRVELADGDVVALVVADAGQGEVGDGGENDQCGYDDLGRALVVCVGHGRSAFQFTTPIEIWIARSMRYPHLPRF